ncbi:MAG: hypothetical protein P1V36_13605, partial [Planctomycetota bacterium]|nr:hypothetical protein [Planctomycetota bacterium]
MSSRRLIGLAALPAAIMLGVAPFAADGARGLWQADAAGLAALAVLWAFAVRLDGRSLRLLALAWPLAGLAHLVLGGGLG